MIRISPESFQTQFPSIPDNIARQITERAKIYRERMELYEYDRILISLFMALMTQSPHLWTIVEKLEDLLAELGLEADQRS